MFDPRRLIADLDAVFIQFPDLAEDDDLREYVIACGTDFVPAIKACLNQMFESEGMVEGLNHLIGTFNQRKTRLIRRQDAMRSLIQKIMEHAQATKYTLPEATLSLSQRPRQVVINDETILPPEFVRTKTEPDKAKIKSALLEGQVIEGACLSNGGISLTVRTK